MRDVDNSFEGVTERKLVGLHEQNKVASQRYDAALKEMRGFADLVFQFVSKQQFQLARAAFNRFGKTWTDAPAGAKGATYTPAELERVIRVCERLVGQQRP